MAQDIPDERVPLALAKDAMVLQAPSNQAMVDLIPGWSSKFPAECNIEAGIVPLFEDSRIIWGLTEIGGVAGKSVLELGPLEAAHTYMLQNAGASSIIAIEANSDCLMKCLITKEILNLDRARFHLGNFMPWLNKDDRLFDVIIASGVLYHMTDPLELLHLIGAKSRATYLWTHYIPDDEAAITGEWCKSIAREDRIFAGKPIAHYSWTYGSLVKSAAFCGGIHSHAFRLRRTDILHALRDAGFSNVEVAFEDHEHIAGPCFSIAAWK